MEVAIAVTLDAAIRTSSAESIPSVPIFRWPSRTAGFAQQHDGSGHRRGVSHRAISHDSYHLSRKRIIE